MKQIIGIDTGNYIFNPLSNTISIVNCPELSLENFVLITDVATNQIIYNFAVSGMGGIYANNILTLDLNVSALSASDPLQIIINTPSDSDTTDQIKIISDTPGQQSLNHGIPVALVNEHIFDMQTPVASLYAPLINTNIGGVIDCLQYRSIAIQIMTGAGISGGVLSFEGSNNIDAANSAWAVVALFDQSALTTAPVNTLTLAASANKYFAGPILFRYFRIRVSTAVAGGQVSVSSVFRMTSFAPSINQVAASGNLATNIVQLGGQPQVTAGLAGTQAVGGNIAPGTAPTTNPLVTGGVDTSGLVRRTLTDKFGQTVVVGTDPFTQNNSNPVAMSPTGKMYQPAELFEMMIRELKMISYYLKEMPYQLNIGQNFKETIDDFTVDSIDKLTNT